MHFQMTGDPCDGARDGLENIMQVAGDGIGGLSGRPTCEFQPALTAGGETDRRRATGRRA